MPSTIDPSNVEFHRLTMLNLNFHGVEVVDWQVTLPSNFFNVPLHLMPSFSTSFIRISLRSHKSDNERSVSFFRRKKKTKAGGKGKLSNATKLLQTQWRDSQWRTQDFVNAGAFAPFPRRHHPWKLLKSSTSQLQSKNCHMAAAVGKKYDTSTKNQSNNVGISCNRFKPSMLGSNHYHYHSLTIWWRWRVFIRGFQIFSIRRIIIIIIIWISKYFVLRHAADQRCRPTELTQKSAESDQVKHIDAWLVQFVSQYNCVLKVPIMMQYMKHTISTMLMRSLWTTIRVHICLFLDHMMDVPGITGYSFSGSFSPVTVCDCLHI